MKSTFLSLDVKDFIKGLIVTVIGAILTGIYQIINTGGELTLESLKVIGITGLGAGLSYLLKNYFSNSEDKILTKEKK